MTYGYGCDPPVPLTLPAIDQQSIDEEGREPLTGSGFEDELPPDDDEGDADGGTS
jgi:hypothetical protein